MKELCGQSAQTFRPTLDGWLELIHPADRAAAQAAMATAMRERRQLHNQYRIVRPDGSIGHVESVGAVVADSSDGGVRLAPPPKKKKKRVAAEQREDILQQQL